MALDGTEYFCSQKLGCAHCLTRKRSNGALESCHTMLAFAVLTPGRLRPHHDLGLLMPEFIEPQDGHDKQDCEPVAASRWLIAHGPRMARLKPVYLGDDLVACQPTAEAVIAAGGDFIFTCKPDSHKALYDFIAGAEAHTLDVTTRLRARRQTISYRWFNAVPMRDGAEAMTVNFFAVSNSNGKSRITYKSSFITSLGISKANVAEIAACARARWKIENESFNVLKNNGHCLEHNFGHGKDRLAMLFAAMNLLAFAFHCASDILEGQWQAARTAQGSRSRFFMHLQTITAYMVFPHWDVLLQTILTSKPPCGLLELQNQPQS